uniref:Uncharacterized protein n=1 Tax=Anguilla anguilla TaxID=7936 RepID=A0A0E9VPA7_ANGAN
MLLLFNLLFICLPPSLSTVCQL